MMVLNIYAAKVVKYTSPIQNETDGFYVSEYEEKSYISNFRSLMNSIQILVISFEDGTTKICMGTLVTDHSVDNSTGLSQYLYSAKECFYRITKYRGKKVDFKKVRLIPLVSKGNTRSRILRDIEFRGLIDVTNNRPNNLEENLVVYKITTTSVNNLMREKYSFYNIADANVEKSLVPIDQNRPENYLQSAKFKGNLFFYTPVLDSFNLSTEDFKFHMVRIETNKVDSNKIYINGINTPGNPGTYLWQCLAISGSCFFNQWTIKESNINGFKLFDPTGQGDTLLGYNFMNLGAPLILSSSNISPLILGVNIGPMITNTKYLLQTDKDSLFQLHHQKRIAADFYAVTPYAFSLLWSSSQNLE